MQPYSPSAADLEKIADPTHVPGIYVVARKNGKIHGGERAADITHAKSLQGTLRVSYGECDEVILIERDQDGNWQLYPE